MASYTIEDLNELLFTAMEKVMAGDMDLDRAAQVAEIGQVVVNAAKVTVQFYRDRSDVTPPTFFGPQERTKVIGRDS